MNVHEVNRLQSEIDRLEIENSHLKDVLSDMADATFVWIAKYNRATLRALKAERELAER